MKPDQSLVPSLADQKPYQHKLHNDIRIDEFYWLKERDNPEVIDYLERENDYYQKSTEHLVPLQEDLFDEMKGELKKTIILFHISTMDTGTLLATKRTRLPIYTRKKDSLNANEEILFDCNKMAEGHAYFRLVGINISPDNSKAIFGIDTVSRRQQDQK